MGRQSGSSRYASLLIIQPLDGPSSCTDVVVGTSAEEDASVRTVSRGHGAVVHQTAGIHLLASSRPALHPLEAGKFEVDLDTGYDVVVY
jgi:hypothetical protein